MIAADSLLRPRAVVVVSTGPWHAHWTTARWRRRNAPDDEVAVGVVDEGGDAPVRVDRGERGRAVLALVQVDVDSVVREAELLEHVHDLPVRGTVGGVRGSTSTSVARGTHHPFGPVWWL